MQTCLDGIYKCLHDLTVWPLERPTFLRQHFLNTVQCGSVGILEGLLSEPGGIVDANWREESGDDAGLWAIHLASLAGREEMIVLLLSAGALLSAKTPEFENGTRMP